MSKNYKVPEVVEKFYHAANDYDVTLLSTCFAENSVMYDEGKELHGSAEISEHITKSNKDAKVALDITNFIEQNEVILITVMITGEFDGSPVSLDFHFTLDSGKIKTLDITLEGE